MYICSNPRTSSIDGDYSSYGIHKRHSILILSRYNQVMIKASVSFEVNTHDIAYIHLLQLFLNVLSGFPFRQRADYIRSVQSSRYSSSFSPLIHQPLFLFGAPHIGIPPACKHCEMKFVQSSVNLWYAD